MKSTKNNDGTVTLTLENQGEVDACAAIFRSGLIAEVTQLAPSEDSYGLKNFCSYKTHELFDALVNKLG